jgi:hypothetical protein
MGSLIDYAGVSTPEQSLDLKLDELNAAGCKKIITNKIRRVRAVRPELESASIGSGEGISLSNRILIG